MRKMAVWLGTALLAVSLAGCGAAGKTGGAGATDTGAAAAGGNQAQANAGGGQQNTPDFIGKIKSISGETVTMYKSSMQPGRMGGRRGGSQQGSGGQNGGTASNGSANGSADGGNGAGRGGWKGNGSGGGNGAAGSGGKGRSMAGMFTDETVDVQITKDTKVVASSFQDGKMVNTDKSLSDLKEGDIVTVWLKSGTQEAETIMLRSGFGGGRMGRQGGAGNGGGQASGTGVQDTGQASGTNG